MRKIVTWLTSLFVVISIIYSVQLGYKTTDRLIHFTVLPLARHFKQDQTIIIISTIIYCTHVIRRITNEITVMYITHGFMVGLGHNGFTNPIISSCLEISSTYNPFSTRFPFPVAMFAGLTACILGDHARVQNSWHLLE